MSSGDEDVSTSVESLSSATEPDSLWQRWLPVTGPFYHSCGVTGLDTVSDTELNPRSDTERPGLQFCSGLLRLGLRNTPVLILIGFSISFLTGQLNNFYLPVGTYLPLELVSYSVDPLYFLAIPLVIVWGAILARIFRTSVNATELHIHRSVFFFGTVLTLLAGVSFSIYLVVTERVTGTHQHVLFQSGYFLFLLLEGHLAYDGLILRGENLFWNLTQSDIVNQDGYTDFLEELKSSLSPLELGPISALGIDANRATGPYRITPGLLFALVLLAPVIPLPLLAYQTANPLLGLLNYSVTTVLQIFLIGVLFQFVVLLWQFRTLLSGDYLDYKPFHPDEHGGYRALGRFATRVNVMLLVAGGYVAFRFVTGGIIQFRAIAGESVTGLLTWGASFVAPIFVYLGVVILWLYFSFWRMHRQMRRGRRKKIQILQQRARRDADRENELEEGKMEDLNLDAPPWEALRSAPVWPIKRRSLIGIAVLDFVPVLVTFLLG